MTDMDVKAILENGEELILIGPVLTMSGNGKVIASSDLFSCWHGDACIQIPTDELLKAQFSDDSIKNIELIITDELPITKRFWIGLLSELQILRVLMNERANYQAC